MTRDQTAKEFSRRTESLNQLSVSPRPTEKQKISLDIGTEWLRECSLKADLPDGEEPVKDEKDSARLENDELCFRSSDDDDDEADEDSFRLQKEKKAHSVDEIKHTRYLRMKPPHHWLPKIGNVPKELLSSSIIIGHTKVAFESVSTEVEQDGNEEEEEGEVKKYVNQEPSREEKEDGKIRDATE